MPDQPSPPPVPLADLEIAQRIAAGARSGGPADRSPTVAQLLLAFGEAGDAGPAARERVARALDLAGVKVTPPLAELPGDARVTLGVDGAGSSRLKPLLIGGGALAVIIAGVALAASLGGGSGDRASSLPAGSSSTATTVTTATTTVPSVTTTATTPATTTAPPTTTTTSTTTTKPATTTPTAAERRRAKREAARRRRVTVSLTPAIPTYVCVDNAAGVKLFGGNLTTRRVFRAKRIRVNIGLSSVRVVANGKQVPLTGSPTGYLFAPGQAPKYLPLGQRPEC